MGGAVRALVTGGTGFLGRALVQRLRLEGVDVGVLVRGPAAEAVERLGVCPVPGDVRDWGALRRAAAGRDLVFHCAARVASAGRWVDFLDVNVLGTERVIQAALEAGARRIVHVSSIAVYGPRPEGAVISEEDGYDPDPRARGFYTRSKIEADRIALEYAAARGAPVAVIRPGSLYGPGGPARLVRAGVSLGWLHVVFGRGENLLPLAYVDNVVDAIWLAACRSEACGRAYNVVDDEPVTQRAYLRDVASALGRRAVAVYVPLPVVRLLAAAADRLRGCLRGRASGSGLVRRISRSLQSVRFDTSRAAAELGWKPRVGFQEAVRRMRAARGTG